jgi:hypothetical protein
MTSQGSASGRFTRAIQQRNLLAADVALLEIAVISRFASRHETTPVSGGRATSKQSYPSTEHDVPGWLWAAEHLRAEKKARISCLAESYDPFGEDLTRHPLPTAR